MGKIYCLPFNGDIDFSLNYAEKNKNFIYEFYGTDGFARTGRYTNKISTDKLEYFIKELKKLEIGFNYLINAISIESYILNEKNLFEHLKIMKEIGVSCVTVSHPNFVNRLRKMGFKVSTSLVQNISELPDVDWAETFGYDRIIVSDDLNRNIKKLRKTVNESSIPIEIIANNICMPYCPLRQAHYSLDGVLDCYDNAETVLKKKASVVLCRKMWSENPSIFLKSGWVRPEEIVKYIELGVKLIKIGGRDLNSDALEKTFDYYLSGECNGYVFDYLRPLDNPLQKYGLKNIKNKDMDNFFDFFWSERKGCTSICNKCHYCDKAVEGLFEAGAEYDGG